MRNRICRISTCFHLAISVLGLTLFMVSNASSQEELLKKLSTANDKEVVKIANRLSGFGIESPKAQRLLMEKLKSENINVRGACVDAIFFVGKPTDEIIAAVFDSMNTRKTVFPDARPYNEIAVDALERVGPQAMPQAVSRIKTDNKYQYFGVMDYFHRMGADAKSVVPQLVERLKPDDRLWATTYAIAGIGPDAKAATDKLIEQLDHKDFNMVCIACRALAAIGPEAKKAKTKLLEVLKKGNVSTRGRVMQALGGIGVANDSDVKPLFKENLAAFHQTICDRTMIGIGYLGREKGKEFIPMVEATIASPKYKNKPLGALTLYKIGGPIDAVLKTFKESIKNLTLEVDVMRYYAELGPDAKAGLDVLNPYLESEDDYLKAIALESISKIDTSEDFLKKVKMIAEKGDYLSMRTAKQILKAAKSKK